MAFSVTSGYVFKDGEFIAAKKLNLMFSGSSVSAINATPIGQTTPDLVTGTTIKPTVNFVSSDGTAGITQASTSTVGKSLTFKNGICVNYS